MIVLLVHQVQTHATSTTYAFNGAATVVPYTMVPGCQWPCAASLATLEQRLCWISC